MERQRVRTARSVNEITAEDWTIIEANDAVFLPAAGDRWETSVGNVGYSGHYWSASCNGLSVGTWYFADDRLFIGTTGYRYDGRSVRLVRDVE